MKNLIPHAKPKSPDLVAIVNELARDQVQAFVTIHHGSRPSLVFYAELSGNLFKMDQSHMIHIQNENSGKMKFNASHVQLAEKSSVSGWRINVHIP